MSTSFTNFKNRSQTLLSQAVTSTASIWTLVDAGEMPTSSPFFATCEDEIVKATSRNVGSNQICVTRGQDGTTAAAHSRFDSVEQRIVKGMFTEIHGAVNSLESQVSSWDVSSISAQITSFFVSSLNGLVSSVFCNSLEARVDSVDNQVSSFFVSSLNGLVSSVFCNSLEARVDSIDDQMGAFYISSLDSRVDSAEDQLGAFYISSLWNFVGSTFCGSHVVETSGVHGATGDILATTDVQSVANKWTYDCQFRYTVETLTGSAAITNSSHVVFVNPSTPITINLTESTADTAGRPLQIKQVVTSFAVIIQPYTAQHIDAASDYTLTDIDKYINLIDCGSGWNMFGSN